MSSNDYGGGGTAALPAPPPPPHPPTSSNCWHSFEQNFRVLRTFDSNDDGTFFRQQDFFLRQNYTLLNDCCPGPRLAFEGQSESQTGRGNARQSPDWTIDNQCLAIQPIVFANQLYLTVVVL